ncbi:adrenocortical dysplasia protein homolog [Etheostoma cragini]|uniref:adrenocortical dysplasia protein homolog n=1 Tax=Etheostoma cragini TaxID=417921 RepID=UPI00155E5753|nr:adrenocortical dysplasia protein homolog [Etheostoma cragini]
MHRAARSRLSPWIEHLILSYGGPGCSSSSSSGGRLKAHVVGVGQMSQSQAQGSEGPTGLLFLSDGVLQIPAILTGSAWEHLQDHEDRECFTSLVNSTVCIQDYRLQFHMAPEQTKCRFYLSIGELATTAAGPLKNNTPCSTTQASIRLKICKTWRALLGQETQDSQKSPCGFDLSELLGEWQHECLQVVLGDVQERLGVSQQPSTSTLIHPDTSTVTSWGVDRVTYKGVKCFKVPIKCLLIPEEDAQQLQTPQNVGSGTTIGRSAVSEDKKIDSPQVCELSDTMQLFVDNREWQIAKPACGDRDQEINENSPRLGEDSIMLHEDMIPAMIDSDTKTLSNPWDIFAPPFDTSSSSDASPEATPTQSPHNPTATEFKSAHSVIPTSTQPPVHGSKEDIRQTESSKRQHSSLPPYQKLPHSASFPTTAASVTSPKPFLRPSTLWPSTGKPHTGTAQQRLPAGDQEGQILGKDTEVTVKGNYRKAKRKRSEPTVEEEEEISGSPPSWLFDTQAGSGAEGGSSHQQGQSVGAVVRRRATVHSDGMLFSYSYQVSGANLLDFSQFTVAESLLHWAVKYLVPKTTDTSGTSNQTNVTPL